MTCIAWDGTTLAADKLASAGDCKFTTTKLYRLNDGSLAAGSGSVDQIKTMIAWLNAGADPEKLPDSQKDKDDWSGILVIKSDKTILKYERTPHPVIFEDKFVAIGSGRDYAMAAMHLGKTASEAVEVAIALDSSCGMGIDTLTL